MGSTSGRLPEKLNCSFLRNITNVISSQSTCLLLCLFLLLKWVLVPLASPSLRLLLFVCSYYSEVFERVFAYVFVCICMHVSLYMFVYYADVNCMIKCKFYGGCYFVCIFLFPSNVCLSVCAFFHRMHSVCVRYLQLTTGLFFSLDRVYPASL